TAIREHLAGLPPALRAVLDVAAVIGREVQASVVAELCRRPSAAVEDELQRGIELGVLVERGAGRIAFAHGLIAETVHHALRAGRRPELPLAVADPLARAPTPARPETAPHLLDAGAGPAERAAGFVRRAAGRARRQLAFEPAAQLIERSLAIAPTTDKAT